MNDFLNKLKTERKLELVEESENMCESYLEKSSTSLKSAKILLENSLYENSISMSYYSMYNVLLATLFRIGIKSENHTASILLLKLLFKEEELYNIIFKAKKERIDKQYYVTKEKVVVTKAIAEELFYDAESFLIKMKLLIKKLNNADIIKFRSLFEKL